jgi:NAD(P)-dependent dehydrogenase (short-subunit alcohol dehydrogenase family)
VLEGAGHQAFPFDLADLENIPAFLRTVASSVGPLAGLVHSAGLHGALAARAASVPRIDALMRTNVYSALMLVRGFCHKDCRAPEGSIVFLSSVAALAGSPALSLYGASKAALLGMTKSLAAELARDRIRVNCVTPGMVKSELTDRFEEQLLPEQFEAIARRHPLGIGHAQDVASAIAFLLADTGRWITGTSLVVDGGYTAV